MPLFSRKSLNRLEQCDLQLQDLMRTVVLFRDCTVITGTRNKNEQDIKFANGESKVQFPHSKHNHSPSQAIDIAPYPIPDNWGEDHPKDMAIFYQFAAVVIYEAKRLGIKIRWGGDWDGDGDYKDQNFDDLIHFELIG